MKGPTVILFLIFSILGSLHAQDISSVTPTDSIVQTSATIDTTTSFQAYFAPKPKKALILSFVLPGAGQFYNKRWWKVPLVYGALGGMYAVVDYNQSLFRRFRDALDLKRQGLEHEFSGTQIDNERSLTTIRNGYDKNTQVSYFAFILVYSLQALEAFVDAHLKNFDMGDDLSFQVRPTMEVVPSFDQPVMGIGLSIPLNGKTSPLRQNIRAME